MIKRQVQYEPQLFKIPQEKSFQQVDFQESTMIQDQETAEFNVIELT